MKSDVRELIRKQISEIGQTLFGMEEVTKIFCLSKVADLTIMLLGPHATAKSSLAREWSKTTGLRYRVVTSSEVDESLIAYIDPAIFRERNIVQMRRGELMETDHIVVDEFFLWNNKYRAKLHQLLEERTYAGLDVLTKTYTFLSNPLSEFYAGQIEERNMATVDRIDLFVPVNQPKTVSSEKMIRKFSRFGRKEKTLGTVVSWAEYLRAREEIKEIEVPSRIVVWLTLFSESMASCKKTEDKFSVSAAVLQKLCAGCNENAHLCSEVALSKPRFLRATLLLAKGLAWLSGKNVIGFEEVNEATKYTLPHRLAWVRGEKSFAESLVDVPRLIQVFNDDMLAWKNRGVFRSLNSILEAGKKEWPVFLAEDAKTLQSDIAEIHVLRDFVGESLGQLKVGLKTFYLEEGQKKDFQTRKELEVFLESSGLDPFEREELAFGIAPSAITLEIPSTAESKGKLLAFIAKTSGKTVESLEGALLSSLSPRIREIDDSLSLLFEDRKEKEAFEKEMEK